MGPQGPLRETRLRFVVGAALADTLRGLNAELLKHFRQLEELPDDDLKMFVKLIGAYLRDHKAKQAYA